MDSISAGAANEKSLPADMRISISNAPGGDSYAIASFSWVLLPIGLRGTAKGKGLADFLVWVVADGQRFAADLYYAPLPPAVALQAKRAIEQMR